MIIDNLYCKDYFVSKRFVLPDFLKNESFIEIQIAHKLQQFSKKTAISVLDFIEDNYWTKPNQKTISPVLHIFSNKAAYKQMCKDLYGNLIRSDWCAYIYAQ